MAGETATDSVEDAQDELNRALLLDPRSAEAQVFGARETLRNTEQNVLLDAVIAYMDVLRDGARATSTSHHPHEAP